MSDVPIKDYADKRLEDLQKAIDDAKEAMLIRLESMNELRDEMRRKDALYFTRPEHVLFVQSVEKDLRDLRDFKITMETKASQSSVNMALIISLAGLVLGIVSVIHLITGKS